MMPEHELFCSNLHDSSGVYVITGNATKHVRSTTKHVRSVRHLRQFVADVLSLPLQVDFQDHQTFSLACLIVALCYVAPEGLRSPVCCSCCACMLICVLEDDILGQREVVRGAVT